MTDLLPLAEDDGDDDDGRRGHGLRGLLLIVLVALAVVGVLSVVISTSGGSDSHTATPLEVITDEGSATTSAPLTAVTATASHHASASPSRTPSRSTSASASVSASASRTASASASRSTHPSASATQPRRATQPAPPPAAPAGSGNPCPSQQICALDSVGGTVSAVANYRVDHGLGPAFGEGSAAARECAVTRGDSCRAPSSLTIESALDGAAAVADIAAETGNFLLDPRLGSYEVGWAYEPSTGRYFCAILGS